MIDNNVLADKSFAFALRCINLYRFLTEEKREFVISKQILRSGTSIGANIKESVDAQSKADFGSKLSIAKKEAGETEYWIELLAAAEYISVEQSQSLLSDCKELLRMLISSTKKIYQLKN